MELPVNQRLGFEVAPRKPKAAKSPFRGLYHICTYSLLSSAKATHVLGLAGGYGDPHIMMFVPGDGQTKISLHKLHSK